ncbi:hypothetical protein HGRIS_003371 [Hohenbuehelia grisea]
MRLKVLAKQMAAALEALGSVESRAFELHLIAHPEQRDWVRNAEPGIPLPSNDEIQQMLEPKPQDVSPDADATITEDDDVISLKIHAQKYRLLKFFMPFWDRNSFDQLYTPVGSASNFPNRYQDIMFHAFTQYARRIVFYDPGLFIKAIGKISLKDMVMDPEFTMEDASNFAILCLRYKGIGLLWFKDAIIEAIEILSAANPQRNTANVGSIDSRVPLLGGWIYNRSHRKVMSNEGWWHLITGIGAEADIENRFMRLCNNFDDLHAFLSFGSLGIIPPPSFCTEQDPETKQSPEFRKHLSLLTVAIADMVSPHQKYDGNAMRYTKPAKKAGCVSWAQIESRAHIFGAVRLEPDAFTARFLDELRQRPDLFQVIIRAESSPGREIESFGMPDGEAMSQSRMRNFEAPVPPPQYLPKGTGPWNIGRSAVDVLYGTDIKQLGYLTQLERPGSAGWFFHFKKFQVKYLLILDAVPGRNVLHLACQVSWAALRAGGYAEGEYSARAYAVASDKLFHEQAHKRLGWMPKEYGGWTATSMAKSDS